MDESWHIPRASLGSSQNTTSISTNSNNSQKSNSKQSTIKNSNKKILNYNNNIDDNNLGHKNGAFQHDQLTYDLDVIRKQQQQQQREQRQRQKERQHQQPQPQQQNQKQLQEQRKHSKNNYRNNDNNWKLEQTNNETEIKRGSHSSQGSTNSNHSSQSASSGSLLLTAANLEKLAQIHKKQQQQQLQSPPLLEYSPIHLKQYHTNITTSTQPHQQKPKPHHLEKSNRTNGLQSIDNIESNSIAIPIDESIMDTIIKAKTKDFDTMSIASSTHFTVVNGMGRPERNIKDGPCSRAHQITVLIITMSLIFLIGIVGAIFFLELRAQKMPH